MKYLTLSLAVASVVCLGSLRVARTDPMPVEGTRELRLGNSLGLSSVYGPGLTVLSPEHGSNMTLVSVGIGLGYFVAEHVEVGGSVGYIYDGEGGSSSIKGPGLSAFLRLYSKSGNVAVFVEPTLEYQHLGVDGVNTGFGTIGGGSLDLLGPGADLGVEVFLVDSWALRVSPSFRYDKVWVNSSIGGSGDTHFAKFGLNWGISAYF
jgi:hypothetical protein